MAAVLLYIIGHSGALYRRTPGKMPSLPWLLCCCPYSAAVAICVTHDGATASDGQTPGVPDSVRNVVTSAAQVPNGNARQDVTQVRLLLEQLTKLLSCQHKQDTILL